MRILFFSVRWVLRRYEDVVAGLVEGGHEVVIASPRTDHLTLPKRLRELPRLTQEIYDEVSSEERGRALALLRQTRDYLWYLGPEQQVGSYNRRRALDTLVRTATSGLRGGDPAWPDPVVAPSEGDREALDDALAKLDARIEPDPGVLELIEGRRPDAVLVTPLLTQRYHQAEVVKAAQALGVPSGFLVYSWDNLSNKGRIHGPPDRIFVWNELQRREAVELHGTDPESVVVTGAPHWDEFFAMEPSVLREELCAAHGFDPARPIVLYLGSTNDVVPDEPRVVERWLEAVRAAAPPLGDANVLVRRHPGEEARWAGWEPRGECVSLSREPHIGGADLYDELHHAAAAVGLNTSAQIEASIVGTPVYTFSGGALAPGQAGSRHFYYLLKDEGGVVSFADTLEEHVAQLGSGVAGNFDRDAIRRFAESFVRPHGLDRPVSPILTDEILKLAGRSRRGPLARLRSRSASV